MAAENDEENLMRSAALQNAQSIFLARQRAERALIEAQEALKRKSEELAQQRAWFQVTLFSIGDAVITTDTEAKVTFLNPVAEALTGWKTDEASGQPLEKVFNIVNEETRQPALNPVGKVLREGNIIGLANHTALISRDGTETSIEDSAAPIRDATGRIIGAVMVFHDVTERRRAERSLRQSEEFNRTIIESSRDCHKTLSLDGELLWISESAQKILCICDAREVIGTSWVEFWKGDDRKSALAAIQAAAAGGTGNFIGWYSVLDQPRCWDVVITPITDPSGQPEKLLAVSRDVTERRRLDEVHARLAAVVEFSDDAIISKTLESIITTWNKGAERIFGYASREVIGKPITILIPPDRLDEEPEIITRVSRGETVPPYETIRMRKDGTLITVSLTVSPVKDSTGAIIGVSKIARDITERKQAEAEQVRLTSVLEKSLEERERLLALEQSARAKAEEAENRARFLAEASASLASTLDYEATLGTVAQAAVPQIADWCAVHMRDHGGAIRPVAVAHADSSKLAIQAEIRRRYPHLPDSPTGLAAVLRTGKPLLYKDISEETLAAMARGDDHLAMLRSLGPTSLMIVPLVANERTLGAITFVAAESGRHFTEADLRFTEDLAARAAAAAENARLYQELRHANAAKDHFMAVLSHELRTPLNPVLMTVADLEHDRSLPPAIREQLAVVRRNVELEARLIDDLLDSTGIASGKLQLHRTIVNATELIRRAVAIVESDARTKGVRLEITTCSEPCPVDADPARLQQVVWNIVKNAVKFTPQGGWVRLHCEIAPPGLIRVTVQDNGIGIAPENLGKIFNAFEQGDNRTGHRFGGLGLGLAISKALVTLHGGVLTVQSEGRNRGATFIIELPLATQAPEAIATDSFPAAPRRPLRLLVVEDHEATSNVMVRLLTRRGYFVFAASSIKEALALLEETPVDVLISDVGLPDGSGRDLMEKVRQKKSLPGIALSGYGTEADLAQSSAVGFSLHLTKPVDIDRLDREIQTLALQSSP
jgi:PAS domain S-box-containing protein